MAVGVCPNPETLAAFARGDLAAAELAAVSEHLGTCAACCRALQFVPEGSLAGLARAAAASPNTQPPGTVHSAGVPNPLLPAAAKPSAASAFANHPRYRILGELGAGGMGTVYKAHDEAMDRVVALKVVSTHLTAKAGALARFRKEVRAAAKLEHVNIVRAYDTGEVGGAQFLVMEFVEGISLDRLVAKKGPLAVPMACAFTRQAALGLQHAAEKGMTHRDIKPQNLMVTRKGQVRILDFGLARFASTDDEQTPPPAAKLPFGAGKAVANAGVTNPNLLMGTPDYLSPEQAKNSHAVDPRSDIYSLGCTLYFLLTGKPPFAGAGTLIDKLLAHTEETPPPIREARFEVSEGLAEVLAKMMAKKPADRYQTAKEAADALSPYTRVNAQEPVFEVVEASVVTPMPAGAPTSQQPRQELAFDTEPTPGAPTLGDTPRPKKKKHKKRRSWWQRHAWTLLGASALFLVVAVALAVLSNRKHADHPKDPPANDPPATAKGNAPSPPQGKGDNNNGNKGDKNDTWSPPTVITPQNNEIVILCVIPSQGVFVPDLDVRAWLTQPRPGKKPVKVEIAATSGDRAQPAVGPGPSDPVPIDVHLGEKLNLSKYSAVVFCGFNVDEYTKPGSAGYKAVSDVLKRMSGKPVAAVCAGQAVLYAHDILKNRKAAIPPRLWDVAKFQPMLNDPAIKWQKWPVVQDDSDGRVVITAAGPPQARELADAILKAVEGK